MCKKICDTCDYSLPYGKDYVNCEKIEKIVKREFSCKFYSSSEEETD